MSIHTRDLDDLRKQFKAERLAQGLSQKDVADSLHMPPKRVSEWESGDKVRGGMLVIPAFLHLLKKWKGIRT